MTPQILGFSLPGPPDMRLWKAYFHIYVDESGKLSGKSEYTSLCGYLGHAQEWGRVDLEWTACRLRYGVPPIHMGRIAEPDRKDDGWKQVKAKWGDLWITRRDRMLDEFATILRRASIACVGAVVDANAYRKIKKEDGCNLVHADSNVFAFHQIIMGGLAKIETVDKTSPVAIIVDDDQENAFGYYGMLDSLRQHERADLFRKVKDRIHCISFADDASYPGLQAADMIAYVARRMKVEKRKGPEEDYETFPASLYPHLTLGGLHQPVVYTEDILYELAHSTAASLEKLRQ